MTVDTLMRNDIDISRPGASHTDEAERARELAARYGLAVGVNPTASHRIHGLELLGWRVLADRRWSGSRRSTIDAILVGPGGVVVLDVKDWQDVSVCDGSLFGSHA